MDVLPSSTANSTHFRLNEPAAAKPPPPNPQAPGLLPHTAPWSEILAQERRLATAFFNERGITDIASYNVDDPLPKPSSPSSAVASSQPSSAIPIKISEENGIPIVSAKLSPPTPTPQTSKTTPIQERLNARPVIYSYSETVPVKKALPVEEESIPIAVPVEAESTSTPAIPGNTTVPQANAAPAIPDLPVGNFAADQKLLRMAKIDFDSSVQKWKATWWKPKMVHFGMVLHSALMNYLKPGASYSLESQGKASILTRTNDKLILQQGGKDINLGAKELHGLLRDKIEVDGFNLEVDRRGNLVLQTSGPKAIEMSHIKGG